MVATVLNAAGLILITIGGIGAALCAPSPQYHPDGSSSLSQNVDKAARIAIYRRQRLIKPLLSLVGVGALLQLVALFVG
ncbi:hypothetical protein [Burkholderia multivorans]|uniref:hypothetical protein n=1 Tax=Burkholderia multivorans TaxID=87883 RepID=UPI000CFF6CC7|nr:hypothetical protein [Burkholderia multivorans]MBU9581333.1 hypothetical protein [Burkholderia multivorans]PRE16965.1 hypothetical protein C6P92_13925 [Burkholderia multivorans]PRF32980.1 hypothetical protein C6Q08_12965 [Burkholderia multivorans]PRG46063.1 hypothetical protein C6T62_05165 [Burkholderia multivorans]